MKQGYFNTADSAHLYYEVRGNSSKGLHGITIKQFACDVYDLINYLDLKDVVLMGWSMGGPILLSYFNQFGQEQIKGLGLIDMTPFPFSPDPWNTQAVEHAGTARLQHGRL